MTPVYDPPHPRRRPRPPDCSCGSCVRPPPPSPGAPLYASFPPRPLWWLVLPGFALLGWVLDGLGPRAAFGLGLLAGLGFTLPLLHWTGEDVGPVPWLALATAEALFIAVTCLGFAAVTRLACWPLWGAAVWARDVVGRRRYPFGGFPWGKIAFGQAESAFLPLAALGGTPLLSFAVVLCGFGLYEAVRRFRTYRTTGEVPRAAVAGAAACVLEPVVAALAALPLVDDSAQDCTVTVRRDPGRRAPPGPRLHLPAPRRPRQPRQAHQAARGGGRGRQGEAAGLRALAGELLRPRPRPSTPTPARSSTTRSGRSVSPPSSALWSRRARTASATP
ncbi:Apolipoprotein N-acyltransferase [Streptomyces microflavus]